MIEAMRMSGATTLNAGRTTGARVSGVTTTATRTAAALPSGRGLRHTIWMTAAMRGHGATVVPCATDVICTAPPSVETCVGHPWNVRRRPLYRRRHQYAHN